MNSQSNQPEQDPLTPNVFYILLVLADGEKHGYGIMKDVEAITNGKTKIRTGTLYGAIKRMIEAGLIEESDARPTAEDDDERRRYYRLTDMGQAVSKAEAQRLDQLIKVARSKKVLDGTSFWSIPT